jgi:hypothetical protein
VRTQYAERKSKYYGPVKLYEYWFTGGNKEVLSYEQTFNSLYYIIQPYSVNQDDSLSDDQTNTVPVSPASTPAGNDVVGKANGGSKINENVRDSVYNEADQYKAQVRIMGDPDFLMETIGGSLDFSRGSSSDLFKQFYHKRGSINPYGGQVFCEIVFYISEDYASNDTGLQEINNQLTFYGSAKTQKILKNKGVIYQLLRVDSVFRRGQFHQTLELLIVPPGQLIQKNTVEGATDQRDANQTGAESARLLRQAGYDTNQTNQSAAVAFRSGVQLNSQAGAGRGSINPPLANPDARQSSVEASKPVPVSLEDPVSGQPVSGSTAPLANTQVVTPGRDGQPVNNDDAAANTSRTVPVPQGGREQTPAGGETTPTREPEPGP